MSSKWFFVEGNLDKKDALLKRGIIVEEIFISQPQKVSGLAFPEDFKERVVRLLKLKQKELVEVPTDRSGLFLLEDWKRELEQSRELYVRECGRRLQVTIEATKRSIVEAEQSIRACQQQIVEAVRAEIGFRKKLEQIMNSRVEVEKEFASEFDRLIDVQGVEKVRVTEGIVQVFTEQIDITFEGNIYDIGKFRIDIYTSGSNGGVRCYNLTRRVDGYCHPHIKGDGSCCLGNVAEGIARLVGNYEYSIIAQVMLQYLKTYNPDSPYLKIEAWPIKKEVEK